MNWSPQYPTYACINNGLCGLCISANYLRMSASEVVEDQGSRLQAATTHRIEPVSYVAVFCATNDPQPKYIGPSVELIDRLGDEGYGIIYGVAHVGLMGVVSDRARAKNAPIIGVAIKHSTFPQGPTDELFTMPNEAARASKMLELADGVAVLPGGTGTTREAVTTVDAKIAGLFDGPVSFLDTAGYYTYLQQHFENMEGEGFLRRTLQGAGVLFTSSPTLAYDHLADNISVPKTFN